MKAKVLYILSFFVCCWSGYAQEVLAPLSSANIPTAAKNTDTAILELPFFDDFADYEGLPDAKRWLNSQAFVNKDFAPQPPTIGMATLDALDANGNLYPQASTNLFSADTMASQIVRLDSLTENYQRRLTPADSIILSFYYLPGGWYGYQWELVGEAPSTNDSLFVDFYDYNEDRWNVVWAMSGHNADTTGTLTRWPWKYVSIKVDDTSYLNKYFRFRFRNYASLDPNPKSGIAGNCDHWNIDYVYINWNRTTGDSMFRDIAFVEKAPSMLKRYQAMPARQYRTSDMENNLQVTIVNRYNQTLASTYSYQVYDTNGQQTASYDGGYENIVSFYPDGKYQEVAVHSNPPVNFQFPESSTQRSYKIVHTVKEGVGGDYHSCNDTMTFTQVFGDYYAYDDGVPENGYGLTSTGGKQWLAYRFDLNTQDTLTAVDLYFNRTRNGENENVQFRLCVWDCDNGLPSTLIYKEEEKMMPEFDGMNRFHRYRLTSPVIVDSSVFIGFEQLSNDYINLGFDRSVDSRQYTFYRTGNDWMQSILKGSIMMRPAFGESALVETMTAKQEFDFHIYPNPSNSYLNILIDSEFANGIEIMIYDMQGRMVWHGAYETMIDISGLAKGVYLLKVSNPAKGRQGLKKLIKCN